MRIDLKEKTVLITGGSRGIGRACAVGFAEAGANVAISYLSDRDSAERLVEEVSRLGVKAIAVQGDIGSRESVERFFQMSREALGAPDIVVANAGIWKRAPIDEMSDSQWAEMLRTNLTSVFLTCQLAARQMKAKRSGSIIVIGSTAGQRGEAFYSHYAATKGGVMSFVKSLAGELGPFNIRINCVAPGWVDTDMCKAVFSDDRFRESVREGIPLQRIPSPEDLAGVVLFLASDLSCHVHGEIVNVNGGSVLCG